MVPILVSYNSNWHAFMDDIVNLIEKKVLLYSVILPVVEKPLCQSGPKIEIVKMSKSMPVIGRMSSKQSSDWLKITPWWFLPKWRESLSLVTENFILLTGFSPLIQIFLHEVFLKEILLLRDQQNWTNGGIFDSPDEKLWNYRVSVCKKGIKLTNGHFFWDTW